MRGTFGALSAQQMQHINCNNTATANSTKEGIRIGHELTQTSQDTNFDHDLTHEGYGTVVKHQLLMDTKIYIFSYNDVGLFVDVHACMSKHKGQDDNDKRNARNYDMLIYIFTAPHPRLPRRQEQSQQHFYRLRLQLVSLLPLRPVPRPLLHFHAMQMQLCFFSKPPRLPTFPF